MKQGTFWGQCQASCCTVDALADSAIVVAVKPAPSKVQLQAAMQLQSHALVHSSEAKFDSHGCVDVSSCMAACCCTLPGATA